MITLRTESFAIAPEHGASFLPGGGAIVALSLPHFRAIAPGSLGALAVPSLDGADRYVGLYQDHGFAELPPYGGERLRIDRVRRVPDPLVSSLVSLAWDDLDAATSDRLHATGEVDLGERCRILALLWRALVERRTVSYQRRIGGQSTGRAFTGVLGELELNSGRAVSGLHTSAGKASRGAVSLTWITGARILEAPCPA